MITEFINTDMLIAVVIGLSGLLMILYVDKYFTRRRMFRANALFTQNLHDGRKDSSLHWVGFVNRRSQQTVHADFVMGPEVEVRRPGFFSRRRVVTDNLGRIVATHYEEMVVNDLQPRLQLTRGGKLAA